MASSRPFRFGVLASLSEGADWTETGRRAESLGYSTFVVSDHIGPRLAPYPVLATVGAATSTLRLGTLVAANDLRHPVLSAMDAATVDQLTEGRFEFGLGTGWLATDYDALGLELDRGGVRIDRLEEALDLIDAVWSGEQVQHRGRYYSSDLEQGPQPYNGVAPPLMLGGSGPRMLRLAAGRADIVSITATAGVSERGGFWEGVVDAGAHIAERVGSVQETAGERWDDVEINVLLHEVNVTSDLDAAIRRAVRDVPGAPSRVVDSPHVLIGDVERIIDTLVQRRDELSLSYHVVPLEAMDLLAPVVERLTGT